MLSPSRLLVLFVMASAIQSAPAGPQFDVVSIKPNVGGALPAGPPNFRPDGGFTMIRVPISVLIGRAYPGNRSEEHTSELQSLRHIVCRLLLEKKNSI